MISKTLTDELILRFDGSETQSSRLKSEAPFTAALAGSLRVQATTADDDTPQSEGNLTVAGRANFQGSLVVQAPAMELASGKGQLSVLSNDAWAQAVGGKVVLGGSTSPTENNQPFATVAGSKENAVEGDRAGYLQLAVSDNSEPALVERMRITSAGKVGIGTAAPDHQLQVENGKTAVSFSLRGPDRKLQSSVLAFEDNMGTKKQWFRFIHDTENNRLTIRSPEVNPIMTLQRISGRVGVGTIPDSRLHIAGGKWNLKNSEGDFKIGNSKYRLKVGVALAGNGAGDVFVNAVGGTGRLMMGSRGHTVLTMNGKYVGIGTRNPRTPLHIYQSYNPTTLRIQSSKGFGKARVAFWSDPQGSGNEWRPGYIQSGDSGGFTGQINFYTNGKGASNKKGNKLGMRLENGNLTVYGHTYKTTRGGWLLVSDKRLKTQIKPLTNGLSQLLKLRGVHFKWKEPQKHGGFTGKEMGFIAQEVAKVLPSWVETAPDGNEAINMCGFEAMVVEALRELKAQNDSLQQQNKTLEAQLRLLEQTFA